MPYRERLWVRVIKSENNNESTIDSVVDLRVGISREDSGVFLLNRAAWIDCARLLTCLIPGDYESVLAQLQKRLYVDGDRWVDFPILTESST
jgi:hypothetical protein